MKQTFALYRRLFLRSMLLAGAIFGGLHLLSALVGRTGSLLAALFLIVLTVMGTALVQGGLVEIVRSLHVNGDDDPSIGEALSRASGRVLKLVRVSFLSGLGIGLGCVLLLVPGLILATRWAVAVPVAMLEDGSARDALRRSRQIVDGHGRQVFAVLFRAGFLVGGTSLIFGIVGGHATSVRWWVAVTVGSALTTPFAAHALTVVYYELVQPERPVVLEPGHRWESVWQAQEVEPAAEAASAWDEYERRFDERNRRWGN